MNEETDLKSLADSLGYCWPADEAGQKRVLIQLAQRAAYWRKQCAEHESAIYREKIVQHLQRRCWALAKRLSNVRRAAIEYKQSRDFDLLVKTNEYIASQLATARSLATTDRITQ